MKLANLISVVFHPIVIPTLIFASIFGFAPILARPLSDEALLYILMAIFITTLVIPLCSMGVLKLSDYISSLAMRERKERVIPFLFVSVFYGITTYMFYAKMQLNTVLVLIMLAITLISFLIAIITFFWKISAHSAAIAGMMGFFIAIMIKFSLETFLFPVILSVLLVGIVMSARLYLNSHTPSEILGGGILGFTLSFGIVFLFT